MAHGNSWLAPSGHLVLAWCFFQCWIYFSVNFSYFLVKFGACFGSGRIPVPLGVMSNIQLKIHFSGWPRVYVIPSTLAR